MTRDPYLVLNRAIAVHQALLAADIDNAIGGALALAYHVERPRATDDIDVNISLTAARCEEALAALPADVPWDAETVGAIARDEQVRIWWPVPNEVPMPLDLFFMADILHEVVRRRSRSVPMLDHEVRVISATDLTIFKALFNRSKDWPDIEEMLAAHDSSVDLAEAVAWVSDIVGATDPRTRRLAALGTPGSETRHMLSTRKESAPGHT